MKMKMRTKIRTRATVLLIIVIVMSLLVGCGQSASKIPGSNTPTEMPEKRTIVPAEYFIYEDDNDVSIFKIHDFMLANGFKLKKSKIIDNTGKNFGSGLVDVCNTYKDDNTTISVTISASKQTGVAYCMEVFVSYDDQKLAWKMSRKADNEDGYYQLPGITNPDTADFNNGDRFCFLTEYSDHVVSAVIASIEHRRNLKCPFEMMIELYYESEAQLDSVFGYVTFYELKGKIWEEVRKVVINDQIRSD